jgi:hypothetical protein
MFIQTAEREEDILTLQHHNAILLVLPGGYQLSILKEMLYMCFTTAPMAATGIQQRYE